MIFIYFLLGLIANYVLWFMICPWLVMKCEAQAAQPEQNSNLKE